MPEASPHPNIEAILALRRRAADESTRHERVLEHVTRAAGRPAIVYLSLAGALVWMAANAAWARFAGAERALDPPPFVGLELVVSVLALLMTLSILTTQNRERRVAEDRAHLELQINLLAEHKITTLISLVEELRRDLPNVPNREDSISDELKEAVDPHAVLDALGETNTSEEAAEPDPG